MFGWVGFPVCQQYYTLKENCSVLCPSYCVIVIGIYIIYNRYKFHSKIKDRKYITFFTSLHLHFTLLQFHFTTRWVGSQQGRTDQCICGHIADVFLKLQIVAPNYHLKSVTSGLVSQKSRKNCKFGFDRSVRQFLPNIAPI